MKVKGVDDLDEYWRADVSCQHDMFAKVGSKRFSRLFAVINRTFRDRLTHGHTRAARQPA